MKRLRELLGRVRRGEIAGPAGGVLGESGRNKAAAYWDGANLARSEDVEYWLAVPQIRAEINRRASGNSELDYVDAFFSWLGAETGLPVERAASFGCGVGDLERKLIQHGIATAAVGVDISRESIDVATKRAQELGLAGRIDYKCLDAATWLEETDATLDLAMFHGVLHHLDDLEAVLSRTAFRLRGGRPGYAYVYEYVGPSRTEWSEADLAIARYLFGQSPVEDRRTPDVWPPLALEDPSEMIRSSAIDEVLKDHFEVVDYRPLYGNVVVPLINALRGSSLTDPQIGVLIESALEIELVLGQRGLMCPSHFAIYVLRPKPV